MEWASGCTRASSKTAGPPVTGEFVILAARAHVLMAREIVCCRLISRGRPWVICVSVVDQSHLLLGYLVDSTQISCTAGTQYS